MFDKKQKKQLEDWVIEQSRINNVISIRGRFETKYFKVIEIPEKHTTVGIYSFTVLTNSISDKIKKLLNT